MNNLYFALTFFGVSQFFGLTDNSKNFQPENSQKEESFILKDSLPGCSQTEIHKNILSQHPEILRKQNQWETARKARVESGQNTARRGAAYELPVVVHVIHTEGRENISDAQIDQAMEFLNQGFAAQGPFDVPGGIDTEFSFRLANRDPDSNPTTGINRVFSTLTNIDLQRDQELKDLIRWDPTCYINIWIVAEICSFFNGCGIGGYATLPPSHGEDFDGIVVVANYFGTDAESAVVPIHEMGHYLGLYHTFDGGCKNDDCLVDGDQVCDTPPDQSTARIDCADGVNSCSTDVNASDPNNPFTTDQNDQMENFMDYASCSVLFTQGQKERMVDAIENVRFSLLDESGCGVAFCDNPVTANFSASATNISVGETVIFTNNSIGATIENWAIDGVPFPGNLYIFNEIGTYEVTLEIIGDDPICIDNFSVTIKVSCPVKADFTVDKTDVPFNEIAAFTNTSADADNFLWTVNGNSITADQDFDFSSPTPGIYRICLEAENAFCKSKKCTKILVTSGTTISNGNDCVGSDCEDCLNGIDDNGDGLIDFYDPDCLCVNDGSCSAPYYQTCTDNCLSDNPFTTFSFTKKQTQSEVYYESILAVADVDGDCVAEIIYIGNTLSLTAVDGITHDIKYTAMDNEGQSGQFATADIDNDGMSEMFVMKAVSVPFGEPRQFALARYDYDPAVNNIVLTWKSDDYLRYDEDQATNSFLETIPSVTDFNQDGRPEVVIGNQVYDSETGVELTYAGVDFNVGSVLRNRRRSFGVYNSAVAFDLLDDNACTNCEGLELVAGNQIFSVNIQSYTDVSQNSMSLVQELPGFGDGLTGIADFDTDGDMDVIISDLIFGDSVYTRLYVWDAQTPNLIGEPVVISKHNPGGWHSTPTIGDLDGDGQPEIVISGRELYVFEDYDSGGGINWGSDFDQVLSGSFFTGDHAVGSLLFDFNLDGKQEIVNRSKTELNIFDKDLNILANDSTDAGTSIEYPVIADIDNDNEAELITFFCPNGVGFFDIYCGKIAIIESAGEPWANTRKVWNQYSFFNTNINEDGSVPKVQQKGHLVTPALNSFNQQYAIPKSEIDCFKEVCDNGIDDDGNGLIDFYDPDCICVLDASCTAPYYQTCTDDCLSDTPFTTFSLTKNQSDIQIYWWSMLAANDFDGDCKTDIAALEENNRLIIIDPITQTVKYRIEEFSMGNFTTGDVDGDGMAEIFITRADKRDPDNYHLGRYEVDAATNSLVSTWMSAQPIRFLSDDAVKLNAVPMLADFNGDGRPEVNIGNQIFDSQTGIELTFAGDNFNRGSARGGTLNRTEGMKASAIAVDLLPDNACVNCSGLELAAGNQVFAVSINSYTDPSKNSIEVVVELPGFKDGHTSFADFDLDGDMDLIVADYFGGASTSDSRVYVWDAQTPTLIGNPALLPQPPGGIRILPPTIGDLDADGMPEIIVNNGTLFVLEDYKNGGETNWGNDPSVTIVNSIPSGDHAVGTTLFDFNLDGKQEIIIRNFGGLKILDGNLNTLFFDPDNATTEYDYAFVADIDDDNEAELVTYICPGVTNGWEFTCGRFTTYESAAEPWANTRKIWNQYSFANTNINEDGSIPTNQQQGHLVTPALNSFNQQYAIPESQTDCIVEICTNGIDDDGDGLVDELDPDCPCLQPQAFAKIEKADCGANGIDIEIEICNEGEQFLSGATPVTIYGGDPTLIDAPLILTFELPSDLAAGECISLKKTIAAGQDSVFVMVNDDGSIPRPFDLADQFPVTSVSECNYLDNLSGQQIQFGNPTPPDLGPDETVCDNGVFPLDAGDFETYRWFDGSRERTVTVFEPGTYWVETADICGNVQSDTIVIGIDPISEVKLGTDLTVCEGDTVRFDAGTFDDYKWLPKPDANCDTCQVFALEISQDTQIVVTVASDLGCFSTDTVNIFIGIPSVGFDSIFICRGDTISVNGTRIYSDTLLSQNINSLNGCDSILNTKIIVNDSIFIKERIEICAGDTAFVFGNPITQNDTLIQIFNRINGCDSTRRVEVEFKPRLFESDEMQFCEGDTAMIFGNAVTENDTLSEVFTSAIGCDSTSEIQVVFTNSINTDEDLDICAGDTVMVFGNEITSDSTLFETYNSLNGCDSTHEVRVNFRPAISGGEMLIFCEGDTAMIFGNMVIQNDTVSKVLTAADGCDSLTTIEVIFNQNSISSDVLEVCAGDTARVFGLEILNDTTVSETLQNFIGCDSIHTVEVIFNQSIQGFDSLQICAGDTAFLFGNAFTSDTIVREILTAAAGCDSIQNLKISFFEKIETNDVLTFCEGDTAMIFGLEILSDTTVSETIQSINGCDSTHTIDILFNQKIETFEQLEYCTGDTVFLFGNTLTSDDTIFQTFTSAIGCDSTHNIDVVFLAEAEKMVFDSLCTGDILLFFNDTISETGTYFQTVPSVAGSCDTNYVLTAEFFEDPVVDLVADTLISVGESFEIPLNISDSTLQITWSPNGNLICEDCSNPTVSLTEAVTFEATITNERGCSVVARINVRVADDNGIYVPTGFSPNGDSNNDFFTAFAKENIEIDQLQIFDRWGGLLFELNGFVGNDPTTGWDGTAKGMPVNSGVYVYKFLIRNSSGEQEMLAGDVTVYR